jgi:arylsulfatase A-like enzyme
MQAKARAEAQGYYAHCTALDTCIGDLMETLAQTGLASNTIVVFSSDHGEALGSHGVPTTQKQVAWSESAQVPFLLRVPGIAPRKVTTPITTPDVLPTLLALSGVTIPKKIEGEDLSPLLRTGRDEDRAALYMSVSPFAQVTQDKLSEYRAIRTSQHTYVRRLNGPWLLYDHTKDRYEMNNLIEDKTLVPQLDARLQAQLKRIGDDFRPGKDYIAEWGFEIGPNRSVPYQAGPAKPQIPRRVGNRRIPEAAGDKSANP